MRITSLVSLLLGITLVVITVHAQTSLPGNPRGYTPDALREVFQLTQDQSDVPFDALMQACPARDCIPSIDQPVFIPATKVDFLREDDLVLAVTVNGISRAYPTRILDRHEIVNDTFDSVPVAVTYCPLCGSGLAFERELNGRVFDFGVSSLLHNSDLVMYDRQTESLWQQITGKSFAGDSRGLQLVSLPMTVAIWGSWRREHPDSRVLTVADVKSDRYMRDAYADYAESEKLYMPVSAMDARLHPKRIIYGMEIGDRAVAIDGEWLSNAGEWTDEIAGQRLVVAVDNSGGVTASIGGVAIPVHRMYWFAWYSFHPRTALIDGKTGS